MNKTSILNLLIVALFAGSAASQESIPQISYTDRQEQTREIRQSVNGLIEQELRLRNLPFENFNTHVQVEFDTKKLENDFRRFKKKYSLQKFSKEPSKVMKDQPIPEVNEGVVEEKIRFGSLNIDIERPASLDVPRYEPKAAQTVVKVPPFQQVVPEFRYQSGNYISSIFVKLTLYLAIQKPEVDRLQQVITAHLSLNTLPGFDPSKSVEIVVKPPPPAKFSLKSWGLALIDPRNSILSVILLTLGLGGILVFTTVLLTRSFANIARTLKDLKPVAPTIAAEEKVREEKSSVESTDFKDPKEAVRTTEKSQSDTLITVAEELAAVRNQLSGEISDHRHLVAELLLDIFYEPNGMGSLRDLLSFMGYKSLKPALDLLAPRSLQLLQAFVEDTREEPSDLMNGVKIAQRIFRETATRAAVGTNGDEVEDRLRYELVKADDRTLDAVLHSSKPEELALIIKELSIARGNQAIKPLPTAHLKKACERLDDNVENKGEVVNSIVENIQKSYHSTEESGNIQRRFIMRLMKNSSVADEDNIRELIPDNDWEMKKQLLKTKVMYCNLIHVPGNILRQVLDSMSFGERADILSLVDNALKKHLLAQYRKGSKLMDMLTNEMELINRNKKRRETVRRKKEIIISEFLRRISHMVREDEELVSRILQNEAESLGINLEKSQPDVVADVTDNGIETSLPSAS